MDPNKRHVSSLETLPQDLLGIIVSKVGATDPEAYVNCISSCKELGLTAIDERVCKALNMSPLVNNPLASTMYPAVMKKCLDNYNADAHYIKGIWNYFVINNTTGGFHHLSIAADQGHKEAIYLYAILLLCRGRFEEGKQTLGLLKWAENSEILETCWTNIKKSLRQIRIEWKVCYAFSLRKMEPNNLCNMNDMENTCDNCVYYKRMFKYIFRK